MSQVHVASSDGALVISTFSPSNTTLDAAQSSFVHLSGEYPFSDSVNILIGGSHLDWPDVRIRIPCFATNGTVTIEDGETFNGAPCSFLSLGAVTSATNMTLHLALDIQVVEVCARPSTLSLVLLFAGCLLLSFSFAYFLCCLAVLLSLVFEHSGRTRPKPKAWAPSKCTVGR